MKNSSGDGDDVHFRLEKLEKATFATRKRLLEWGGLVCGLAALIVSYLQYDTARQFNRDALRPQLRVVFSRDAIAIANRGGGTAVVHKVTIGGVGNEYKEVAFDPRNVGNALNNCMGQFIAHQSVPHLAWVTRLPTSISANESVPLFWIDQAKLMNQIEPQCRSDNRESSAACKLIIESSRAAHSEALRKILPVFEFSSIREPEVLMESTTVQNEE